MALADTIYRWANALPEIDYPKAVHLLQSVMGLDQNHVERFPTLEQDLGARYLSLCRFTSARNVLEAHLTRGPTARTVNLLASACQGSGDHAGAQELFRKAAEMAPHDMTLQCLYGVALIGNGMADQARGVIEAALAGRSQDPARSFLGLALQESGDVESARRLHEESCARDPNNGFWRFNLATWFWRYGSGTELDTTLKEVHRLNPVWVWSWSRLLIWTGGALTARLTGLGFNPPCQSD
jgi:Flp pilus assembly protein TadD